MVVLFLLCLLIMPPVSASIFFLNGTEIPKDQIHGAFTNVTRVQSGSPNQVYFFYDRGCQSCEDALDYVRLFGKKNPKIPISYYDLGYSNENRSLFTQYKSRFNTTNIRYPAVFINSIVISGSSDVIHYTEPLAKGFVKQ